MMIYTNKGTIGKEKVANRTLKLLNTVGVSIFVAVLMSGCAKDKVHHTPHPDKGVVRVTTDWLGLSEDATQPESYLLQVGELTHTVNGADNAFKHLLDEGNYTLLVRNTPIGITINGTKADVNTLADGTLTPMPDYLFSAVSALHVVKDDTLKVKVKMVQSLRVLQLRLKLNAGDETRIASTTATLTGIAQSIDLATGKTDGKGTGKTVVPSFKLGSISSASAVGQSALIANLRLAGVVNAEKQLLSLSVTLADGTVVPIKTDITEALTNFRKELKPLSLDAELSLPNDKETEATGKITDWEVVDNGNITIH